MKVEVLASDHSLLSAVVNDGWLADENDNYMMGAGRGAEGRLKATEVFAAFARGQGPGRLLGVYVDGIPAGFFIVLSAVEDNWRVRFHVYMAPEFRSSGATELALAELFDTLFAAGTYRIEVEIMRQNKSAVRFARHMGFTQEAVLFDAVRVDGHGKDLVLLRLLKREWKRRRSMTPAQRRKNWVHHGKVYEPRPVAVGE